MSLSHLPLVVKIKFFQFSTQTQAEEDTETGKCTDCGSLVEAQVPATKEMASALYNVLKDPQTCDPLYFPGHSKSDHGWGGCEDSGSAALDSSVLQHTCAHTKHTTSPRGRVINRQIIMLIVQLVQYGGQLLNNALFHIRICISCHLRNTTRRSCSNDLLYLNWF